MPCDLSTTQLAACESGIGKLDNPISLLQIIAQLSCEIADAGSGGATTPSLPLNSVQFNNAGAFGGSADLTFNDATNVLALTGSQTIAVGANTTALALSGYSLTGANAQSALSIAGTWNTSGTPTAIDLNITDTASNAASLLMNLRTGGLTSMSVSKDKILSVGNSGGSGAAELKVHQGGGNTFGIRVVSPKAGLVRNSTLFFTYYDITSGNTILDTIFGGAKLQFMTAGVSKWEVASAGHFITGLDNTYDIGASGATRPRNVFVAGSITTGATTLHTTSAALANGAGAGAGTLGNAPTAGDPAKWISIVDNGTTRYIPTWI